MHAARINGLECILFIGKQVPPELAPDGYRYCYHLRHDECDWGRPISIEPFVAVNFFGTVFMKDRLDFGPENYIDVESFSTDPPLISLRLDDNLTNRLLRIGR